jgi:hypothetical protein
MKDYKGHRLYVNLGPSKVRRRLQGHGFGVKKVQSAGRNQAVIVHTATGEHLRQLQQLFADVPTSTNESDQGEPLENLRNLGPATVAWLNEINLHTKADLVSLGPAAAYRLIKRRRPETSLSLLWSLAAALEDRAAHELSQIEKQRLQAQAEEESAE